jgi:hypothetical protein
LREQSIDHGRELVARAADASQVGERLDAEVSLDASDQLDRARARAASGAVGDRDEVGLERGELLEAAPQYALALLVLGRKKFEAEDRALVAQAITDLHVRVEIASL